MHTTPLAVGQKISGVVEKLVFGGAGLIRHDGMVIFVPDVIPGERVLFEVTKVKARYAEGVAFSIEVPSEYRREPLCPYSGMCGGCQLQHIDPAIHAFLKKQWLREALYGVISADFPIEVVPSDEVWGWRRKITLHARWDDTQWVCGYIAKDNVSLLAISSCPLFFSEKEAIVLKGLQNALGTIPGTPESDLDLTIFRLSENGFAITVRGRNPLTKETQKKLVNEMHRIPLVQSLCLRFPHLKYDEGQTEGTFDMFDGQWHFSTDAFMQNHLQESAKLWADSIALVCETGTNQSIFDLYSGIGVTAIRLAQQGNVVTAVELSKSAVQAAKKSAMQVKPGCKGYVNFVQSTVEEFLPTAQHGADWWIVNPPRTGLSNEVVLQIIEKRPKRLMYVSCSAPTLARDIKLLVKEGWHLVHVKGYDMFPQTTHFETLVVMSPGS